MKSSIFRLAVLAVVSLVVGAAGCSGCDNNEDGTNNGLDCPDGIIIQGECIRNNSDGGGDTDTPDASDAEDTDPTDTQPDPDGDGGTDIDGVCLPFDSRCATATSFETCDPDGEAWSAPQDCPADEVCNDGICVVGEQCEPGEVSGCRSPNSQRVCADDGVSYDERLCPSENPTCFDGECISGQCLPDAVFCDGQELKQCNSTGDGSTVQETCANGCLDGACLEPPDDECGGKSYIGCDFWAVDLDNYTRFCSSSADCQFGGCQNGVCPEENASTQQYAVTVSNTSGDNVDVEIFDGNGNSVATTTVGPNALESIPLPEQNTNNSGLTNNSYQVTATGPVTVHQFNPQSNVGVFSNDASLLLPSNALGKDYVVTGWPTLQMSSASTAPESTNKAYVTIVAAESGQTSVTVNTPVAMQAGSGVSAISAGGSQTFTMNQGQVLQLATIADTTSEYDLTGLSVSADKNVAVFSAHECATVPTDSPACDHLEQQMLPTNTWGNEYVAPKFRPRGQEPDIYRIISATDGNTLSTTPSISGVDGRTLNIGEVVEFESQQSFVVTGTSPISVSQYMVGAHYPGPSNGCDPGGFFPDESNCAVTIKNSCALPNSQSVDFRIGDPAFTINVPTNQFRSDYFVLTPSDYLSDWVSIVHPPGVTVNMDGTPVTGTSNRIQNTNWVVTWAEVQPGAHQFTASQAFGLYSYGYDCFVSYAYPGGLNLEATP